MASVPPLNLPVPIFTAPPSIEVKINDLEPGCPTKICNKCYVSKPLTEYHHNYHNPDQHAYTCKDCFKLAHKLKKDTPREYAPAPVQRECKECHVVKDINMYYKAANSRDGYRVVCKQCAINRHYTPKALR